ncbi:MAG: pyridoxal 5'-phosphate synthase glutaminase subunit PdxT [Dehalococcoidales bacterium]|jgi:5'-phosphate synthase pdxT subunit|nr:pyridoxal 5'-phosphate synthase glutaminase subunit PdxT [Dehalococcoidales bacterium]|tara:strand:+ start:181 stop:828 length:648 start_codon:yes stop_codon:yes gene_type:complete
MRIGVLALQGDFIEHIGIIERLGVKTIPVRKPEDLKDLDGLIIPGGESTTINSLMHSSMLFKPLKKIAQAGLPIMGTCAGTVLIAKKITNSDVSPLALIDMEIRRNAFGRQVDSFEIELAMPALGDKPFPAIFIRAPIILSTSPTVEILARLNSSTIVAARQGNKLAITFHPELSSDLRLHRYFLEIVAGYQLTDGEGSQRENKKTNREAPIPTD